MIVWWASPFARERKGLVSCLYVICTATARSAAQSDRSTSPPILWSYLNTWADQSDTCSSCSINCNDGQSHEDLAPGWSERVVGTTPTIYWTNRAGIWLVSLHASSHTILVVMSGKIIFQEGWTFVLPKHHLSGHQSDLHGHCFIILHLFIIKSRNLVLSCLMMGLL